jgi:hypothetical protein
MLKHCLWCFTFFLSIVLTSCDDEEQPDVQPPVIEVEILQNDNTVDLTDDLRGILDLKISVSDDRKIKSVQVAVDGTVIEKIESVDIIETEVDTRSLADGIHDIRIVVSDLADNVAEKTIQVKTSNMLFSYSVPSGFIQTVQQTINVKKWLVLSDDKGVVFDYKYMPAPGTYTFLYPLNFEDTHFNVTVVNQYTEGQSQSTDFSAQTILNVQPGAYIKSAFTGPSASFDKIHTVQEAANAATHFFWISSRGAEYSPISVDEHTEVPLSSATSDLYVYDNNGPKYFYYPEIHAGETTVLDLDFFFDQMIPLTTHTLPGGDFNFTSVVRGTTATGQKLLCSLTGANPGPIVLYYPEALLGNALVSFSSAVIYYRNENGFETTFRYTGETEGFLPSVKELPASLLNVPSKKYPHINVTSTGTADYMVVNLVQTNITGEHFQWEVTSPFSSQVSFNLPQLPSTLLSEIGLAGVPALAVWKIYLEDHEDITSYETARNYWLQKFSGLNYDPASKMSKEYAITW